MFNWFRPSCPVEPEQKAWIESRMTWLIEQFGERRLRDVEVVLPTPDFFPDPYDGSEESVRLLLDRVCDYVGVDSERIDLSFYSEVNRPGLVDRRGRPLGGSAGQFQHEHRITIAIELGQLEDPQSLVATMAHELGHVLLLADGRISDEDEDQEFLTDLLTVFLGLGVFTANATLKERYWTSGEWWGWSIGKQGYMSQRMYGYAFALFAWLRGEADPLWAGHLRLDVRSPLKKGLRYLTDTGDCTLKPARR